MGMLPVVPLPPQGAAVPPAVQSPPVPDPSHRGQRGFAEQLFRGRGMEEEDGDLPLGRQVPYTHRFILTMSFHSGSRV